MVSTCFFCKDTFQLILVEGGINWETYVELLKTDFKGLRENNHAKYCRFQQYGAPTHTALAIKEYFMIKGLDLMIFPFPLLDLNCIEKLLAWLARKLYARGKEHGNIKQLKVAFAMAPQEIELDALKDLVTGMARRAIVCIEKRGRYTGY